MRDGFELDLAEMTIGHAEFDSDRQESNYRVYELARVKPGRWFVRLKEVGEGDTVYSARGFVRAVNSGRLDEDRLEALEDELSELRRQHPSADLDDWYGSVEMEYLRSNIDNRRQDAMDEGAGPAYRTAPTQPTLYRLERDLFAAAQLEWVRAPHEDEAWLESEYQHTVEFFSDHPGLSPDLTEMEYAGGIGIGKKVWAPPKHADDEEIERSWALVEALKQETFRAHVAASTQVSAATIEDFIKPPWRHWDNPREGVIASEIDELRPTGLRLLRPKEGQQE